MDNPTGDAPATSATIGRTVRQQVRVREGEGERAALVIVTHSAPDAALSATVDALAGLDTVASVDSVMRVEGEH